jgi:hypothetical protein
VSCVRIALLALAVAACAACGEKPQTANAGAKKTDTPPYEGGQSVSAAPGWKAGDGASWDQQMRRRVQNQNEYVRIR